MEDSQIKIFYSWQSDLPGSETRNFIQNSIKDAIRILRDTIEVEADRDTQGEFGSPDIAQTIFSKIDDCDIFVADVSAVCKYQSVDKDGVQTGKIKLMPNPNVMLELGYATQVIGWENVICILNSDYGSPDEMPFDIANRRLTPYSLNDGKTKGEVKRYLRDIIQETVENILENGKRVRARFSNIRVGCWASDLANNELVSYRITESPKYIEHKEKTIAECVELLKLIRKIHIPASIHTSQNNEEQLVDAGQLITMKDVSVLTPIKPTLDLFKSHTVIIKEEDKTTVVELAKKYLGEDISLESDFFAIGALKQKCMIGISMSCEYEGTAEEKEKYDNIMMLEYKLNQLSLWNWYVDTFNGLLFLPLKIENLSTVADEEIDIYVKIDTESAEAILPSEELINPDMKGLEGIIVEEEIIKSLLLMPESSAIQYDTDISYSIGDTQAAVTARLSAAGINGNPQYDSDDYKREITKYIATPIESSKSEFNFYINSLRAREKKWIGPALLIRPLSDNFEIAYSIKSQKSDGGLNGTLTYKALK